MHDFIFNSYVHAFLALTLLLFSIASFALAMVTLTNAYRLRNVLINWRAGQIYGLPLFATFFLLTAFMLVGLAWYKEASSYYLISGGYVFIALNWFVSSYFMSKRYITDHGIVKNINDPSQTVPWSCIQDFIEYETLATGEEGAAAAAYPHGGDSLRSSAALIQHFLAAAGAAPAPPENEETANNSEARKARIKAIIQARKNGKEREKSYTFIYMQRNASKLPSDSWQFARLSEEDSKPGAGKAQGTASFHCFRLELHVPAHKVGPFRKILNHKLGRRFQHGFSNIPVYRRTPYRSR